MPRQRGDIVHEVSVRRGWRIPMYSGLVLSGAFAVFYPSDLVTQQISVLASFALAVCMVVSALSCLFGAVTDRWIGEFAGLPLLAAALATLGISVGLSGVETDSPITVGFALVVVSYSCGLMARWTDIKAVQVYARSTSNDHQGK